MKSPVRSFADEAAQRVHRVVGHRRRSRQAPTALDVADFSKSASIHGFDPLIMLLMIAILPAE